MDNLNPNPSPEPGDNGAADVARALADALARLLAWGRADSQGAPQDTDGAQGEPEAQDTDTEPQPEPEPDSAPLGAPWTSYADADRVCYALARDPFDGPRVEVYRTPVPALGITEPGTARVLGVPADVVPALYHAGASYEPSRHAWRLTPSALPDGSVADALAAVGLDGSGRSTPTAERRAQ